MPELTAGAHVTPIPSFPERDKIRSFYSRTSAVLLCFQVAVYSISIISVFVLPIFIDLFLTLAGNYTTENSRAILYSETVNYIISAIGIGGINLTCFFIGMKLIKIKPSTVLQKPKDFTANHVFSYIIIGLFIQIVMGYVAYYISQMLASGGITNYEADFSTTTVTSVVMLFVYGNIVAPITEELFFRGAILKGFSTVSQGTGIFISALFFALFHENLSQGVLAFTSGLFMGFIAVKHGSLIPGIIVHFAINACNFIFTDVLTNISDDTYSSIYGLYLVGIFSLGIFCLINFFKTNPFPKPTEFQRYRRNVYLSSLPFWGVVLYYVYKIVKNIAEVN
jgi:membrane protease YdiL (CAAX protease family)